MADAGSYNISRLIFDLDKKFSKDQILRIYDVIANILIYNNTDIYKVTQLWKLITSDRLCRRWKWPKHRIIATEIRMLWRVPEMKWFIRKFYHVEEYGWNADFLFGLANIGTVNFKQKMFPNLSFFYDKELIDILRDCPLAGKVGKYLVPWDYCQWYNAPVFNISYDKKSFSFMAGAFACGKVEKIDSEYYCRYRKRMLKMFQEWRIPIEKQNNRHVYISCIWPALLIPWMPDEFREKFQLQEKSKLASQYASALWLIYNDSQFNGLLPYMQSRRKIFYYWKCEDGALNKIKSFGDSNRLFLIDDRIKKCLRMADKEQLYNSIQAKYCLLNEGFIS